MKICCSGTEKTAQVSHLDGFFSKIFYKPARLKKYFFKNIDYFQRIRIEYDGGSQLHIYNRKSAETTVRV
jgi:hypothetical protein